MSEENKVSIYNGSFWDLWVQKLFRNIASVKYQWMFFMYIPVVYGMFEINEKTNLPWISATLGLGFLGGGFITFVTSRIYINTKLSQDDKGGFSTDK